MQLLHQLLIEQVPATRKAIAPVMTTPLERTRSLVEARHLLETLNFRPVKEGSPAWRERAEALLVHFPTAEELHLAHVALPMIFGPIPWLQEAIKEPVIPVLEASNKSTERPEQAHILTGAHKDNMRPNTGRRAATPPTAGATAGANTNSAQCWLPLESVTRLNVTTDEAAFYLNRRPQTLRGWACHQDGPLGPSKIHGRLAWSVADIKKLLAP